MVYDGDGTRLYDYETHIKNSAHTCPTAADIDGDGVMEYFAGDGEGYLYGLRQGSYVEGFPMALGIYNKAVPQLGDFNSDGFADLVQLNCSGTLYAFQFYKGPPIWSGLDWPTYKHDYWRTGWIGADSIMFKARTRTSASSKRGQMISFGPTLNRGAGAVQLELPGKTQVRFRVYDAAGRLVQRPFDAQMGPGKHTLSWGDGLGSGVYFLRLFVGSETYSAKSVLIR